MRFSKLFPAVCVVGFCTGFITVQAADNPAQAAARAALMEKMNAPEAQTAQPASPRPIVITPSGAVRERPGQPTNAVVVTPRAAPARAVVPAPKTNPMPATEAAPTTMPLSYQWQLNPNGTNIPTATNADAQTRARAALEQKMSELNQPNWATPAVAPATAHAPPTRPAAVRPVKAAPPAVKPVVMSPPSQINANYPGKELGLKPIVAPPLPISAAKQAQLQALLERYQADRITPEQYHTERARILAEP